MSAYYVCGTGDASRLPLLTQACVGVCFTSLIRLDVRRHPSYFAAKRADGDEAVTVLVERLHQGCGGGSGGEEEEPGVTGNLKSSVVLN